MPRENYDKQVITTILIACHVEIILVGLVWSCLDNAKTEHINVKIEVHLAELVTTVVRAGNLVDILNVEVQLIMNTTNVKIEQDRQLKTQEETVKTKKKEENLSVFQELKESRIILFLKQIYSNQMPTGR